MPVGCSCASSLLRINYTVTEPANIQEGLHSPKDMKSMTCSAHVTISSFKPATKIPFFNQKYQHVTIRLLFKDGWWSISHEKMGCLPQCSHEFAIFDVLAQEGH